MNFKNKTIEQEYWNKFYEKCVIDVPSQFCVSMAASLVKKKTVVEFGSGGGRDSLYLASIGCIVIAMDLSGEAVDKCNESMAAQAIEHALFINGDMANNDDVRKAIMTARSFAHKDESELIVYSRFVMHSLDDDQEKSFLSSVSDYMNSSEVLYLEFRSSEDADTIKYYGSENHYRRFIDSALFVEKLEEDYGFGVEYTITGQGMACYKSEDPFVTRVIATKK